MSKSDKEIIDNYLWEGFYNEFKKTDKKVKELNQTYVRIERFLKPLVHQYDFYKQYWNDVLIMNNYNLLLYRKIKDILQNKNVNSQKVEDYFIIQQYNILIVEDELELAKGIQALAWYMFFMALPLTVLNKKAKKLSAIIKVLINQLKIAEKQLTVAKYKAYINAGCIVLTALLPPLGLFASVTITGIQLGIDLATDSPKKSTIKNIADKTSMAGELIADGISDFEEYGAKTRIIAKGSGKAFTVVGVYLSVDEVLIGIRNKEQIKRNLKRARGLYRQVLFDLKKMKIHLKRFNIQAKRLKYQVNKYMSRIENHRKKRDGLIRNL